MIYAGCVSGQVYIMQSYDTCTGTILKVATPQRAWVSLH